jgi:hypothetical protein
MSQEALATFLRKEDRDDLKAARQKAVATQLKAFLESA